MKRTTTTNWFRTTLCAGMAAMAAACSTGCQITESGQTLPSPYYIYDDVQYFPEGPEFKLSREAAAMQAFKSQQPIAP